MVNTAWIALEHQPSSDNPAFSGCTLELNGSPTLFSAITEHDWILVVTPDGEFVRTGQVLRVRTDTDKATIYFDRLLSASNKVAVETAGLILPEVAVSRLQWDTFARAVEMLAGRTVDDALLIENQAYIRELLQLAVMDELLGPANGSIEQIVDMNVRDRYLVGRLSPMKSGIAGEESLSIEADEGEHGDLDVHKGRHDPDEIHTAGNQSLVPSSFGMTICVDSKVDIIEVEARWGRYRRDYEIEVYKTKTDPDTKEKIHGHRAKVWQRVPCGGAIRIDLREGPVQHLAPDADNPKVRIQGTVRGNNVNGDRLVTLFLVNAQKEPDENKDLAWVFQPELIVRTPADARRKNAFCRRVSVHRNSDDPEHDALEMIYRKHVEFAVGHGVAVHAQTASGDTDRVVEVRTVVIPQYEVPVTETPGLRSGDRAAMREMIENGFLDMAQLAEMDKPRLIKALTILTDDYRAWIEEQRDRIGTDVFGFDEHADAALERCSDIHQRLEKGISVLDAEGDGTALEAFRFANRVMAKQRIHSIYSLARRRRETVELKDFDEPGNRSWRPFQLAFILLCLPCLADPAHADRTSPDEALADLLWFPTGGGKTEAYLGVAAFAMAIRRLQGVTGGYDGSRGLTVIMRYTLRLLTLQQFQRAATLICAMEVVRQRALASGDDRLGAEPFTVGLWVGNRVTPGTTADIHSAIRRIRDSGKFDASRAATAQLTSCPWCGAEVSDRRDIEVDKIALRTKIYCGDEKGLCAFSKGQSSNEAHPGLPILVVDEEIYLRPPTMMIATVDKFAMMAWRGETRTLFGRATTECPRHGLLWPDANCTGNHHTQGSLPATRVKDIRSIRPPDLIIQDEFHLISGPLGTMVGLYETAVDELCTWNVGDKIVKPKIIASTATVRKAKEQVNNVFMRRGSIFPPSGLDVADNFFSVQRPISQNPGRRYVGVCSPGSSRPAILIRIYTAFLTAAQALFDRFGQIADPYLTTVGYFNSLRELGGMKRLAEDDVQTRCFRVQMGLVDRPGLAQRSVRHIRELTSRVSNRDIPGYLDQLEVKFKADFDDEKGKFITQWDEGETRSIDIVLATNMLSVGIDVNRLSLMVVNGQPKGTAEYIQATSRVGRSFPGLVCTVLAWARPRDLSHYETFEHYHSTFYKHVEAQSVTPFSPRAMDRGLTGAMLSALRLGNTRFNPNTGAGALNRADMDEVVHVIDVMVRRAWFISEQSAVKERTCAEIKERIDEWVTEAGKGGRTLAYEKKGKSKDMIAPLLHRPGIKPWKNFTIPISMREVEPGVRLVMNTTKFDNHGPTWTPPPAAGDEGEDTS